MNDFLLAESVKLLLLAVSWPIARAFEKHRRGPVDPWSRAWKWYADERNFELHARYLEGEVAAVRITIAPTLSRGVRPAEAVEWTVGAHRTSRDVPFTASALDELPSALPERARRAFDEIACGFEARGTPRDALVVLTRPTFKDIDRAAEAVAQLARPGVTAAYR